MSHFSDNPSHCRVDFWKPSGKWYATESVPFLKFAGLMHDVLQESIEAALPGRYIGMTATCLEPYHQNSHPISIVVQDSSEAQDLFGASNDQ